VKGKKKLPLPVFYGKQNGGAITPLNQRAVSPQNVEGTFENKKRVSSFSPCQGNLKLLQTGFGERDGSEGKSFAPWPGKKKCETSAFIENPVLLLLRKKKRKSSTETMVATGQSG